MDVTPENIIINSCEYTPVYLIPSPSATQNAPYIVTQNNHDAQKPVSDNLKRFYENSGNLENGLLSPKPRILKKVNSLVGNNLKLASFLIPKNENNVTTPMTTNAIPNIIPTKPYTPPVTSIKVEPAPVTVKVEPVVTNTNFTNVVNTVPCLEIDRKIVRVGNIPSKLRLPQWRTAPRVKPKDNSTSNSSKHTSVQLLKLGETYHSLNQLSDEQMKIVNKALKIFGDPEKTPKEPAYDPVTNTKFIYKVVSPRDLTVVGKNKEAIKQKKNELKKLKKLDEVEEELETPAAEPTVTRSGRTVKQPKQMLTEGSPQKPKKKTGSIVSCYQCSADFTSLYRLQRHYQTYPTHVPERIHSNLFHCLLAIIKSGSDDDQANMFIQQLEQLIEKLKTLLPCLLKKIDGCEGKLCNVNDDIGRLFGMNPGKYNLNIDALNCVREKDGYCIHNPPPKNNQFNADMSKPSQLWLSKHNEEIANEAETEDCARVHAVDKWPTVSKRIKKIKLQKTEKLKAKRIRLASDSEQLIELGMEDVITVHKSAEESAINVTQNQIILVENNKNITNIDEQIDEVKKSTSIDDQSKKPKAPIQFHSTHFDIRSSPIKPSALVRKFQINTEKITNFEVMQPITVDNTSENPQEINMKSNSDISLLQGIFQDSVELPKHVMNNELNFDSAKHWTASTDESYIKSSILFESALARKDDDNNLIEPSLIHVTDKPNVLFEASNCTNLIETSLSDPKADITQTLVTGNSETNHLYEPSIHVKTKLSNIIDSAIEHARDKSNDIFEIALAQVKERSHSLFEPSFLHTRDRSHSLIEPSYIQKDETSGLFVSDLANKRSQSLFEPNKCNGLFEPTPIHVKEKSNGGYDTSLLCKDEDSILKPKKSNTFDTTLPNVKQISKGLFEPTMIHVKEKQKCSFDTLSHNDRSKSLFEPTNVGDKSNGIYNTTLSHVKDSADNLFKPTMICVKDKSNYEPTFMQVKHESPTNIDINQSDLNNDSRLLSQGHSVLNFLETLGNELAYPETEIRNSSVDFQLDLFSFNSS